MSNVYLTQQKKEEIEDKVKLYESCSLLPHQVGELNLYKSILAEAIVLPVEGNWDNLTHDEIDNLQHSYPNGVIIKNE